MYPLVNDHIAGWNIPMFNRKYIFKGPIFRPAMLIYLTACMYKSFPTRTTMSTEPPLLRSYCTNCPTNLLTKFHQNGSRLAVHQPIQPWQWCFGQLFGVESFHSSIRYKKNPSWKHTSGMAVHKNHQNSHMT